MKEQDDDIDESSGRLTYLLIGGAIGAVLALLFAPKSGSELRHDIAGATRRGIDRSREAAGLGGGSSREGRSLYPDPPSAAAESALPGTDDFQEPAGQESNE